jgi:hypothetical protein
MADTHGHVSFCADLWCGGHNLLDSAVLRLIIWPTSLETNAEQERELIITGLLSWKSAATISSALAAGLGAMSATPIAAVILATGLALAAIFGATLFGLERAFRGYAELVRAKADRE